MQGHVFQNEVGENPVAQEAVRRIVDFASGLCYALGGSMERVADQVYLLVPADVEVSDADTRRAFE